MRVLFLTEGGKNIGFGHIARCTALSQAIKKVDPNSEIKFVIQYDGGAEEFLETNNTDATVFDWWNERGRTCELAEEYDITVIDSYITDKFLYEVISERVFGRLLMIDDYNRIEYSKGVVVNPSVYGNNLDYPEKKGTVYLLGPDYIILGKEFWDVPEKNINTEVKNVLVTLGGSDFYGDLLDEIVDYLKSRFDFNFNVVDVRKRKVNATTMLHFMLDADLCISGGGQTTNELLRVGVPTISICLADNQVLNLETLNCAGYVESVGWYNNERLKDRFCDAILKLSSCEERIRRSHIGRQMIDGKGAVRIAEVLRKKSL